MKYNLDKIFFGHACLILDREFNFMVYPFRTEYKFKKIETGIFYKKDYNTYINLFNKKRYNSALSHDEIGNIVVFEERLIPFREVCVRCNVLPPQENKISNKQLIKKIEEIHIKKTQKN